MIHMCVFLDCLKYVAIMLNFSTLYHIIWQFLFVEANSDSIYWRRVIERNCLHLVVWRRRINVSSKKNEMHSFLKLLLEKQSLSQCLTWLKIHKDNSSSKVNTFSCTEARRGVRIPTWDISDGKGWKKKEKHLGCWWLKTNMVLFETGNWRQKIGCRAKP